MTAAKGSNGPGRAAGENWLAIPRGNPTAEINLFCFPHSGAAAAMFYPWLDALPAAIAVCPVQLPGRGTRLDEPPFTRLEPLAEAAARALLPHLDHPFVFFGHSLGALLSFELARLLRREHGLSPVHLFVSGHNAPHLPDREPPIHNLPGPEFLESLRRLNGTPSEVLENPELLDLIVPILRADFAVAETYEYRPQEALDCPITAMGGLSDPLVPKADLEAWKMHTRAAFAVRMFPGDHFYLNSARPLVLHVLAQEVYATARRGALKLDGSENRSSLLSTLY